MFLQIHLSNFREIEFPDPFTCSRIQIDARQSSGNHTDYDFGAHFDGITSADGMPNGNHTPYQKVSIFERIQNKELKCHQENAFNSNILKSLSLCIEYGVYIYEHIYMLFNLLQYSEVICSKQRRQEARGKSAERVGFTGRQK